MKFNDLTPGIFSQFESLSPEVIKAQRMAELEAIAKYRAERLQAYIDWSNPEKRAKLQAEHAAGEKAAREAMAGKFIDDYRVRTVKQDVFVGKLLPVKELLKPAPRLSWWQRLLEWLRG